MTNNVFKFLPYVVVPVYPRDNISPRPRSGHRIVCDDQHIYCFGGYNPEPFIGQNSIPLPYLFKELWTYNMSNRKWKHHKIENIPGESASAAMILHRKNVMIFGGTGLPFGDRCNNNLMLWHTRNKLAEESKFIVPVTTGNRPPGLYGQSIFVHEGYLYTVGGTNGFTFNGDIHRLKLSTMEWEELYISKGTRYEPEGRYRHEVAIHKNKFYLIGGGTALVTFSVVEIPIFDIETRTWTLGVSKPDCNFIRPITPDARKCHSLVQIDLPDGNTYAYIAGGFDGTILFCCIWRLDIAELQWTLMKRSLIPTQVYFHSATVTSQGCMYMFGGIENASEKTRINNLYKMWLSIPKLSEISWEAVLFYYPQILELSRSRLLRLGIPEHLALRCENV